MANQERDDFENIMRLAETFTDATLQIAEASGLSMPYMHAVAIAVAAEHAQITLRKLGDSKGGTAADWQQYEEIRESFIETLRESARVAAEKERAALG